MKWKIIRTRTPKVSGSIPHGSPFLMMRLFKMLRTFSISHTLDKTKKILNTKPFLQNGFTTSFYLLKCYKFGSSLCLSVIIKPTWLKISGRVYLLKSKFWALPVTLEEPISLYKIRVLTAHRGLLVFSRMKTWGYEWEGHEKNFQGQPLMSDCPLCFAEHCMLTYQFCVSVFSTEEERVIMN